MNIVYMGTPDFAVPALRRIFEDGHQVSLVVTQPDKPRERGKKILPTPVKALAESLCLPVAQPERIKNNTEFINLLKNIKPDLVVVAAYGKILPPELLSIPRLGCVNIHASLLPRHRGAAPIQRSILSGDKETGVTLMHMSEGMDEGDMIAARSTIIDHKTAGELHDELAALGAVLLSETLPALEAGTAPREKQNESLATYAPMIFKKDGLVDFSRNPEEIERRIRAMSPWPGAYTYYKGEQMKLISAKIPSIRERNELLETETEKNSLIPDIAIPGTICYAGKNGIGIKTGGELLLLTRIQMPGKRAMDVSEYLKGNKIEIGSILG